MNYYVPTFNTNIKYEVLGKYAAEYNEMIQKYNMPTCKCHGYTFEDFVASKEKELAQAKEQEG